MKRVALFFLAGLVLLFAWAFIEGKNSRHANLIGSTVEDQAVYYRLKASYLHGAEKVDFDIVVGCGVRITNSTLTGQSIDAFGFPTIFAKTTQDGGVIAQKTHTSACLGQTTANGRVPKDFLPGAIWFDSKDDLSFGIGYFTEDAFENPRGKLKFLGASIEPATKADWDAFQPELEKSVIDPSTSNTLGRNKMVPEDEVKAHLWDKKKLTEWRLPYTGCFFVERYRLPEKARAVLRAHWPATHPRYWRPDLEEWKSMWGSSHVDEADYSDLNGDMLVDGHKLGEYGMDPKIGGAKGYPTRAGGA